MVKSQIIMQDKKFSKLPPVKLFNIEHLPLPLCLTGGEGNPTEGEERESPCTCRRPLTGSGRNPTDGEDHGSSCQCEQPLTRYERWTPTTPSRLPLFLVTCRTIVPLWHPLVTLAGTGRWSQTKKGKLRHKVLHFRPR